MALEVERPLSKQVAGSFGERLYIAGPMRGIKNFNYPTFNQVAETLREKGYRVNCPAENFNGDSTREFHEYMLLDLQMVLESDGIVLLPGWQMSEGAKLEVGVGKALGLRFMEAYHDGYTAAWSFREIEPRTTEGIDQEARRLVYGERAATYGHPRGDFEMIGRLWSAITGTDVTAEMVALMMVCMKLARLASTPTHRDSQVDVIGYALCLARLQEDPAEVAAWEARASS